MIKLGYENTDKKIEIEIYGTVFEISREIENIDTKNIEENSNLLEMVKKILGEDAVEKINEQRKKDGYGEIDTQVALTIIVACTEAYINASTKPIDDTMNNIDRKFNNYNKRRRNFRNKYRR